MVASTEMNLIGPRVRQLRMNRGWTRRELSIRLRSIGWHVPRIVLAQMEANEHEITDGDVLFLAKALRTHIADLYPENLPIPNQKSDTTV